MDINNNNKYEISGKSGEKLGQSHIWGPHPMSINFSTRQPGLTFFDTLI